MTMDVGAVADSLSVIAVQPSFESFLLHFSGSFTSSLPLDNGLGTTDWSASPCCCGHDGGRRFFGPVGRLYYIKIYQQLHSSSWSNHTSVNPILNGLYTQNTKKNVDTENIIDTRL